MVHYSNICIVVYKQLISEKFHYTHTLLYYAHIENKYITNQCRFYVLSTTT